VPQPSPRLLDPRALGLEPDPGRLLVDVGAAARFLQAHVPGARLVEPAWLVDGRPPVPGRLAPASQLQAMLAQIGYHPKCHLVIYDDEGGGWAGRFAWTLDVIGHDRWSVLDGGLPAWQAAGLPMETGTDGTGPAATSEVPDPLPHHHAVVAELTDVLDALDDPEQRIWDVRSSAEYVAGHIPGAIHLDWLELQDPTRQRRLRTDLAALLARHGLDPGQKVITHCQSHHRSGLSYLVGRLLGFRAIRAYHGAWAEWCHHRDAPIVRGPGPHENPEETIE
jgi:thiosulfate/3-mercaptopyruvate sulfurtransferase